MNWLKTLRKNVLELTQERLAVELSVDQGTLSKWERGKATISRQAFQELQDLVLEQTGFDLPANWFFSAPSEVEFSDHFQSLESAA